MTEKKVHYEMPSGFIPCSVMVGETSKDTKQVTCKNCLTWLKNTQGVSPAKPVPTVPQENPYIEGTHEFIGWNLCVTAYRPLLEQANQKIKELEAQRQKHRHHIVCLSGSTRFTNEMMMLTWEFAKQGIIALGWCILPENHNPDGTEIDHHLAEKQGIADLLDDEHLDKIDLADEIFVVNVGGYIGEGTKREIAYAVKTGKPVKYLEALASHQEEKTK